MNKARAPGFPVRAAEHFRALLRPASAERKLPWYRGLWQSVGSISLVPLVCASTERHAFAIEGLLIRAARPDGNFADSFMSMQAEGAGARLRTAQAPRKRPPRFLRDPQGVRSLWSQDVFLAAVKARTSLTESGDHREPGSASDLKGPFSQLYRNIQRVTAAVEGTSGPVDILFSGSLLLSYAASRRPWLRLRARWSREQAGTFLDRLSSQLEKCLLGRPL